MTIHNNVTDISIGSKTIGVYKPKDFFMLKKSTEFIKSFSIQPQILSFSELTSRKTSSG